MGVKRVSVSLQLVPGSEDDINDQDVIEVLKQQPNKQAFILAAIRAYIQSGGVELGQPSDEPPPVPAPTSLADAFFDALLRAGLTKEELADAIAEKLVEKMPAMQSDAGEAKAEPAQNSLLNDMLDGLAQWGSQ